METPEYDMYKVDTTEGACPKTPPEGVDTTPYTAPDHYLNASVLLTRRRKFARGKGIDLKRDSGCNPIGKANAQPGLYTRRY